MLSYIHRRNLIGDRDSMQPLLLLSKSDSKHDGSEMFSNTSKGENDSHGGGMNINTHSLVKNPPDSLRRIDQISKNGVSSQTNNSETITPIPNMTTNMKNNNQNNGSNNNSNSSFMGGKGPGGNNNYRCDSMETSGVVIKPHTGGDVRWDAINMVSKGGALNLSHFQLLKRLGYGDIGSVYLVELRGTDTFFAMKVMDKASLASRNKLLHMLGIVYRDLKPENLLIRDEGHIMLSDFDLSLRCSVSPTLVKSSSVNVNTTSTTANNTTNAGPSGAGILDDEFVVHGCMQPSNFLPRILPSKKNRKSKSDFGLFVGGSLPELMAEPTNVRSMSFVGTHEYLAPEIIQGEGHGSAVDWWTFGIFLYELLHGTTPFKGSGNRATLFNVVEQPLRFPEAPQVSLAARDLIRGLLVKEPQKRIAYRRGATEIKQHPFFDGVNWALVRSAMPPHVPEPVDFTQFARKRNASGAIEDKRAVEVAAAAAAATSAVAAAENCSGSTGSDPNYVDFEYF